MRDTAPASTPTANPLHDWPRGLWSGERESAPERIRTSDLRFRRSSPKGVRVRPDAPERCVRGVEIAADRLGSAGAVALLLPTPHPQAGLRHPGRMADQPVIVETAPRLSGGRA